MPYFNQIETLTFLELAHTYGLWKILSLIWIPTFMSISALYVGNKIITKEVEYE